MTGGRDAGPRVPFIVKVAAVWVVLLAAVFWVFLQLGLDTQFMRDNLRFVALGLPITIWVSIASILLAVPLALLGALGRLSKNPVSYGLATFYTSFIRGTPLIVQIVFVYLALPQIAIAGPEWLERFLILGAITSGILALGVNYGAYMTEIFRAGIQSVSHGQLEAAHALGMTYGQTLRRVVVPQAIRVIIPPVGNEYIAVLKDSSLIGVFGATEMYWRATTVGARDFRYIEALIMLAGMYWILTTIFSFFQSRLEARLSKGFVRATAVSRGKPRPGVGAESTGQSGAVQVEVPHTEITGGPELPGQGH